MTIQPASSLALPPLDDEQQALVRRHVPEEVLGVLSTKLGGDWTIKIPLYLDFIQRHSPDAPKKLRGQLYFTNKFIDSQPKLVEGVALSFFEAKAHENGVGIASWKIREVGFQEGRCVGHYSFKFSPDDGYEMDDSLKSDYNDAHVPMLVNKQGDLVPFNPEAEARYGIEQMLKDSGVTDYHIGRVSSLIPARVDPLPAPAPLINEPVALDDGEPAQPAARAWYQVIGDALGGCIASLVDCFKRFFGLTT